MSIAHPIAKMLFSAAVVLGSVAVGAGLAGADPGASDTPNPFGALSCSCQETDLTGSVPVADEIDRGVIAGTHGMAGWLPPVPE
ncbi:hypothetical protein [Mycobacterium sp.]|uniref:hypothetical protein n=1 Tax=Mycobacterium sp. TaxID=1785 RepID=UPI002B96D126|nr:hypothetical protein [Mycobacterium sp.]HTQ20353.1 hypothetical protein [Mycobacterium sp.]